jgi:NADPH-dependent ferric siderophore reductase
MLSSLASRNAALLSSRRIAAHVERVTRVAAAVLRVELGAEQLAVVERPAIPQRHRRLVAPQLRQPRTLLVLSKLMMYVPTWCAASMAGKRSSALARASVRSTPSASGRRSCRCRRSR